MTTPALPASLHEIADGYDALLCDVWGVIHDGVRSFPAACAALERFGRERGPVVLISNSPRPSPDVVPQLRALGVPDAAWAGFVTSGDATRAALIEHAPGPVWALGPARDAVLYAGLDLAFAAGPDDAAFICCTGPVDDTRETPDDYRDALGRAAARDLLMVCANPDRVVQRGDQLIYCGGALADLYEALGGRVLMAGKPYAPIYALALSEAERRLGRPLDRARTLCIGDGLRTDVAGANREALDLLFVAAGIHAADALGPDGALDPSRTADLLADEGLHARFALPRLV
jgi:HAD superfamily hydrolase (TIGR01459 family)